MDEVCKDSNYKLSIKMRLGYSDSSQGLEAIQIFNDYPVDEVIIHARLGTQIYSGKVDLEAFDSLSKQCNHKVVYNGDIFTLDDFNRIKERFPKIQNYMIGRGALQDPFLASTIKGIKLSKYEKLMKIKDYHDAFYNHYNSVIEDKQGFLNKMKEFWTYTSRQIDSTGDFLLTIRQCNSIDTYLSQINNILNKP